MPEDPDTDPTTALVLSGAGTKGAFEVGALRYLVHEAGLTPRIITATSAGSILAAVLAQARTNDEFRARVEDLRTDLLAMTRTELVFGRQPWLADLAGTAIGDAVDAFITVRNRPALAPDPDGSLPPGSPGSDAGAPPARHHHRWQSLVALAEALPAAHRAKGSLPGHAGSLLTLDPLADALAGRGDSGIVPIDAAAIGRPGLELRLTVTALSAGVGRYVTQDGALVEDDARTPHLPPGSVPIVEGVLASSTVPMVFPPRPLGGGTERYVDGGVVRNIPVDAAVALGGTDIVAVCGVPLEPPPDDVEYADANLVAVHLRTTLISFNDQQRRDLAVPLPDGTTLTVIAPTVDVVGPLEVAQGLMLLDMDYGWLRAAEVLAPTTPTVRAEAMHLSDTVTAAREHAWYAEEALWAADGADESVLAHVHRAKRRVQRAVAERAALGLPTPAEADQWWLAWEHHAEERPAFLSADPWASEGGFTPA